MLQETEKNLYKNVEPIYPHRLSDRSALIKKILKIDFYPAEQQGAKCGKQGIVMLLSVQGFCHDVLTKPYQYGLINIQEGSTEERRAIDSPSDFLRRPIERIVRIAVGILLCIPLLNSLFFITLKMFNSRFVCSTLEENVNIPHQNAMQDSSREIHLIMLRSFTRFLNFESPNAPGYLDPETVKNECNISTPLPQLLKAILTSRIESLIEHIQYQEIIDGLPEEKNDKTRFYAELQTLLENIIHFLLQQENRDLINSIIIKLVCIPLRDGKQCMARLEELYTSLCHERPKARNFESNSKFLTARGITTQEENFYSANARKLAQTQISKDHEISVDQRIDSSNYKDLTHELIGLSSDPDYLLKLKPEQKLDLQKRYRVLNKNHQDSSEERVDASLKKCVKRIRKGRPLLAEFEMIQELKMTPEDLAQVRKNVCDYIRYHSMNTDATMKF